MDRLESAGNRRGGNDGLGGRPLKHHAVAGDDVGGDDMYWKLCLFQVAIGNVIVDQLADAVMRDQEIAPPQEARQRAKCERKDVPALQAATDAGEALTARRCRIAGIERAVQRTTLEPTTMSAVMPWLMSESIMPTCTAPKLPPPAKTKAVLVDEGSDEDKS